MAVILSLKDPRVAQIRRAHPKLAGAPVLARGQFCCVFASCREDRVFKLTVDASHAAYPTDTLSPTGPYKPQVFEDFGAVGETSRGESVHLIEVERLQRLSTAQSAARRIGRYVDDRSHWYGGRAQLPTSPADLPGLPWDMYEFMAELNNFTANFDCRLDTHRANFMQRAQGTLVFSDPVFDVALQDRTWRRPPIC